MKNSIKQKITNYLKEKQDWIAGGLIEDFIRQTDGHKASNVSRRCRELVRENHIEVCYRNVFDVPNKVAFYRFKRPIEEVKKEVIIKSGVQVLLGL